jgi:hypothetical protein
LTERAGPVAVAVSEPLAGFLDRRDDGLDALADRVDTDVVLAGPGMHEVPVALHHALGDELVPYGDVLRLHLFQRLVELIEVAHIERQAKTRCLIPFFLG